MGTRWSIAGIVAGAITAIKIVALATLALADPGPMGRGYALGLTLTLLLGVASSGMLIAGWSMRWVDKSNRAYAEGVSDTVDRLAQALPQPPSIRRVS